MHTALKTRLENVSSCFSQSNLGTSTHVSRIAKPASVEGILLLRMTLELASRIAKDLATASLRSFGAVFKPPRDRIEV